MILDNKKLTKPNENTYRYDISEEPMNRLFLRIDKENGNFVVNRVELSPTGTALILDEKNFPITSNGFSEATDYFEEIINKQINPQGGNPEGENTAPPIGILEILQKSAVSVKMFDGRSGDFRKGEYTLKANIFTIQTDYADFKKGESYYVDVIGNNPKILGIFPIGDLENGDANPNQPVNQDDLDDISEGGNPYNQGEGEGEGEGEGKVKVKAKAKAKAKETAKETAKAKVKAKAKAKAERENQTQMLTAQELTLKEKGKDETHRKKHSNKY